MLELELVLQSYTIRALAKEFMSESVAFFHILLLFPACSCSLSLIVWSEVSSFSTNSAECKSNSTSWLIKEQHFRTQSKQYSMYQSPLSTTTHLFDLASMPFGSKSPWQPTNSQILELLDAESERKLAVHFTHCIFAPASHQDRTMVNCSFESSRQQYNQDSIIRRTLASGTEC